MNRKQRRAAGVRADTGDTLLQRAAAAVRAGDLKTADTLYQRLASTQPDNAILQARLGDVAQRQGDLPRAIGQFRHATILDPLFAEGYMRWGNALVLSGKPDEAIGVYRQLLILMPDSAEAHSNFGTALVNLGRYDEGIAAHRQSIALNPGFATFHFNLGNALLRNGQIQESAVELAKTIQLQPNLVQAHSDLGNVLYLLGERQDAINCYRNAITLDPDFAEAWSNLANPLTDNLQLDEALAVTMRAIQLNPNSPQSHSNFGNVLVAADRIKESFGPYRHALTLNPAYAEAHNNLGHAHSRLGQWSDSIAAYRAAIEIRPDYAEAHLYLAMMLLRRGEMREGWQEYEWRWRTRQFEGDILDAPVPFWRGEALTGKTILLYAEQGLGDTIQFVRYTRQLAVLGANVVLAVPQPLVRLVGTAPGVGSVVALGDPLPPMDYRLPLLSLPHIIGPELSDIPIDIPYLSAAKEDVAAWRKKLAPHKSLKVGLVWAGAKRAHDRAASFTDRRRSLPLQQLSPLFDISGTSFISLQMGEPAAEAKDAPYPLHDYMAGIEDFADTAALVSALDLVITVDTSVAHVAGALGKPVWILSRFDGCWRWLEDGETSPWYPTARLFRQTAPGDWSDAIAAVRQALKYLA